ncbi:MAG: H-type lectin domain-containing protein [Paracoccaceae bacterium]|nr:H-type lectin domain-containing protein [Paracoccaceae bacterium]
MRRLSSHILGIDQGSVVLFSDFQDGGAMWTGDGPRELRKLVEFSETYMSEPVVQVSMSMWDMDQKTNQRADISAEMINPKGFVIVFRTWGDTRVARVRADWLAIGEVKGQDDWDID